MSSGDWRAERQTFKEVACLPRAVSCRAFSCLLTAAAFLRPLGDFVESVFVLLNYWTTLVQGQGIAVIDVHVARVLGH